MIPLTLKEFALAVGADAKWIQNAKPRLSRSIAYTSSDARWLRLTRTLNRDLRIPLAFASELAHAALDGAERDGSNSARHFGTASRARPARSVVCVIAAKSDGVRLTVDLRRERSSFDAALAAAMAFGEARRPGRKRRAPTHYRAALGRAWKLGINVGTLRFQARRAAGARLEHPASDRTGPSARTSHEVQSQPAGSWLDAVDQPMTEVRYAPLADLGPATAGGATDRGADQGGTDHGADQNSGTDSEAAGGGAADDMEVTGEHETPFPSESAGLGRRTRLTAEVLGPPRWRADLAAELQLPEAEARRSLLRRFVDAGVRFVVVGDLAEALAGAAPAGEARARPVLDLCYAPTGANMRRLANVLRELRARPLLDRSHWDERGPRANPAPRNPVPGAPGSASAGSAAQRAPAATTRAAGKAAGPGDQSAPFAADPITLRSSTALALRTSFGIVHVRRDVAAIGGFDDVRRRATRVRTFGLELAVLDLPALARVRTATGTRGDVARLPMLETLLALPALEARHRELAAKRISWIDN